MNNEQKSVRSVVQATQRSDRFKNFAKRTIENR